jgi:hypothetical protein
LRAIAVRTMAGEAVGEFVTALFSGNSHASTYCRAPRDFAAPTHLQLVFGACLSPSAMTADARF